MGWRWPRDPTYRHRRRRHIIPAGQHHLQLFRPRLLRLLLDYLSVRILRALYELRFRESAGVRAQLSVGWDL